MIGHDHTPNQIRFNQRKGKMSYITQCTDRIYIVPMRKIKLNAGIKRKKYGGANLCKVISVHGANFD